MSPKYGCSRPREYRVPDLSGRARWRKPAASTHLVRYEILEFHRGSYPRQMGELLVDRTRPDDDHAHGDDYRSHGVDLDSVSIVHYAVREHGGNGRDTCPPSEFGTSCSREDTETVPGVSLGVTGTAICQTFVRCRDVISTGDQDTHTKRSLR